MVDWQEFSQKRILQVKQRIQTIVIYEELNEDGQATEKEAVVDSYDRPMQAGYQ
jgi:hypothetical protein